MKVTVHKERLARALGFIERVTTKSATLPILSNILLQTEHGRLRASATNLEIGVSCIIGASVDREGQVAVPSKTLSDFIRNAPSGTVLMELKQNTLTVQIGSYKTTILCFNASEYPIIPKIEGATTHQIDAEDLQKLLRSVSDSIAVSDSRPELAGAFIRFEKDKITMAATDIFRLAERKISGAYTAEGTAIIPRSTIAELSRIVGEVSGKLTIQMADNQILCSHDEFDVISRLIDGKYPEYQKVIPERSIAKALVRKSDLENAAKVAALFSSSISDIKLECESNTLKISGKNSAKGEATAEVEAVLRGDPFEVSMNYHYFLDGLKTIPTEKVVLEFTGKGSPFMMRPDVDGHELVYLIMPLRS
jgi:DNA polymerase III subunit beta